MLTVTNVETTVLNGSTTNSPDIHGHRDDVTCSRIYRTIVFE